MILRCWRPPRSGWSWASRWALTVIPTARFSTSALSATAAATRTATSTVDSSPEPRWIERSRSRTSQASAVCSRSNSLTWMSPWRAVDFQWMRLNASPGAQGRTVVASGVACSVRSRIAWLPAANLDGSQAMRERTLQSTPLATTVRPWAPGDAFNRIHWKSTARHGDIQVKEFDLEQTADAWLILDLERAAQRGSGDESTVEVAVRVAAAVADKALVENRAVGMTINAHRLAQLQPDRGGRQHLKVMQLLAAVEGDGSTPLVEALTVSVPRIRRGMTAVVITASLDRDWVKPLATMQIARRRLRRHLAGHPGVRAPRARGGRPSRRDARGRRVRGAEPRPSAQQVRALRHALAEFDIRVYQVGPTTPLAEALAS